MKRAEVPTFLPWLLSFAIAWAKTGQASNSPILPKLSFAEEHAEIYKNEHWDRWSLQDTPLLKKCLKDCLL